LNVKALERAPLAPRPGSGQYALGVRIVVPSALSVLVGYPANFLVLALAGGGGLVVMAVVARVRSRSRG
jgi:hypothetical protein